MPHVPWSRADEELASDADTLHYMWGVLLALPQDRIQHVSNGPEGCGDFCHVCKATQLDLGAYSSMKFWLEVGKYGKLFLGIYETYSSHGLGAALKKVSSIMTSVHHTTEALLPHLLCYYDSNLEMCFSGAGKFQPMEIARISVRYKDLLSRIVDGSGATLPGSLPVLNPAAVGVAVVAVGFAGTWHAGCLVCYFLFGLWFSCPSA